MAEDFEKELARVTENPLGGDCLMKLARMFRNIWIR